MTDQKLPDWYINRTAAEISPEQTHSIPKAGINIRKALASFGEALAREVSAPPCLDSWLGRIEPRAKIIAIFLLVFTATLIHSLSTLTILLAVILLLTVSIKLPVRSLGRIWIGVPVFSLAIILPATTNFITPGHSMLDLFSLARETRIWIWTVPQTVSITDSGLIVAGRFLLRTLDCITLSYLLIATTDPVMLLNGLRRLGMPKIFGMVLTMAQRYLSAILQVAEEIHLAKLSRTIAVNRLESERRWVAAGIGMLFRRTYRLAEEVQNAMIARGYDGDLKVRSNPGISPRDLMWAGLMLLFAVVLVVFDRIAARSLF